LLALGALVVVFAFAIAELGQSPETASQVPYPPPDKPLDMPTLPPYPPPGTSRPADSPRAPTFTRPPDPPTRTPTPTFTPAPPTPTPEPLPTLIPDRETFLYATTGEKYPEIYRVQGDPTSRVVGPVYRVDTPFLWGSRIYLGGLYPSPDGKWVAVDWVYGEGGTFVSILDVNNSKMTSLFGEKAEIDQRVIFLDWSPDGSSVLVLGRSTNPDLRNSIWLVDVSTHAYKDVGINQKDGISIASASFSPDGQEVVYTYSECAGCTSGIWRASMDGSEKRLLFEHPTDRIEEVRWSPQGDLITFVKRQPSSQKFVLGELWVMDMEGGNLRQLATVITTAKYEPEYGFAPAWSPDGSQIAFVSGEVTSKEPRNGWFGNIYVVDVRSGSVSQVSSFENTQVLNPTWSPDGLSVAFAASPGGSPERFEPWAVVSDGRNLSRLDKSAVLVMGSLKSNPMLVWLPASLSEGEGQ